MNAAVVLEPDGALRECVAEAKAWVRRELGARVYLDDPPHTTLFAGTFADAGELEPLLAALCATMRPVTVRTTEMLVFRKDVRAGGGDTVVLKIDPTPELFDLQRRVADALRSLARLDVPGAEAMTDQRWRQSALRYGWPFVGAHWIPHVTIAALDGVRDGQAVQFLMGKDASFETSIREIGLWDVIDTHARPRARFELGGAG